MASGAGLDDEDMERSLRMIGRSQEQHEEVQEGGYVLGGMWYLLTAY